MYMVFVSFSLCRIGLNDRFRRDLLGCVTKVLDFQSRTGSPVLINAYPYFAYQASPKQVTLDFVLFQSSQGIIDPSTNLHYDNMLFAQIDAFYYALYAIGYKNLTVHVSETGWPSKGDVNEMGEIHFPSYISFVGHKDLHFLRGKIIFFSLFHSY